MAAPVFSSLFHEFKNFLDLTSPLYGALKTLNRGQSPSIVELQVVDTCEYEKLLKNKNVIISNAIPLNPVNSNYIQLPLSWYGIYSGSPEFTNHLPVKDLCCFINRFDILRQSWLYQLIRRDLFHRGFVSFNLEARKNMADPRNLFEHNFSSALSIFEKEHEFIKDQVPYRNFDNNEPLADIIMKSKFSIILETWAYQNEMITFSEKIFRNLRLPRPWVIFTSCNGVRMLHEFGFDVLYDIVDHDYYDTVENSIERQSKILDLCEKLCELEYTDELINRLEKAAAINIQKLDELLTTCEQDINQSMILAQECLKNQNHICQNLE